MGDFAWHFFWILDDFFCDLWRLIFVAMKKWYLTMPRSSRQQSHIWRFLGPMTDQQRCQCLGKVWESHLWGGQSTIDVRLSGWLMKNEDIRGPIPLHKPRMMESDGTYLTQSTVIVTSFIIYFFNFPFSLWMGSSLPYCVFSFQSSEIGDAQQDLDDPCEKHRFVSDLKNEWMLQDRFRIQNSRTP